MRGFDKYGNIRKPAVIMNEYKPTGKEVVIIGKIKKRII